MGGPRQTPRALRADGEVQLAQTGVMIARARVWAYIMKPCTAGRVSDHGSRVWVTLLRIPCRENALASITSGPLVEGVSRTQPLRARTATRCPVATPGADVALTRSVDGRGPVRKR